ncbi:RNA-binding protein [Oculatella sp. FACHB-28]|uniref:RNA recognition motif domain-containing protein n=1 Tax=Cyanophyceae TaxID=3028117 RepID=UPI001682ADAD|nr:MULTISPECIES: RNA-binding protein [Cyanophyceae]MBD1870455.1 RNA-binding protein [Cyanobacteria bacterium FACHB-471]MBD2055583.1 RNA-binding protein [Oculatella sp. FACHB-28]MBD2069950.1 RNA-binding protein [Leptolyngbya sp. FACHB-671]
MSIRLYVGNLPRELERQELETVFAEFDDSVSTKVITDRKTGKCRGFGFVTVKNDEQADQLIEKFNGFVLKDSALKIEKALPRSKGKDEGDAGEAETNVAPVSAKRSKGSGGGGGGKSKRPAAANSSDPEAVQPDPRWAQDLEKLKQLLATQTANS